MHLENLLFFCGTDLATGRDLFFTARTRRAMKTHMRVGRCTDWQVLSMEEAFHLMNPFSSPQFAIEIPRIFEGDPTATVLQFPDEALRTEVA